MVVDIGSCATQITLYWSMSLCEMLHKSEKKENHQSLLNFIGFLKKVDARR